MLTDLGRLDTPSRRRRRLAFHTDPVHIPSASEGSRRWTSPAGTERETHLWTHTHTHTHEITGRTYEAYYARILPTFHL